MTYYDPALTQKRALVKQQYDLQGADYNWQKNALNQSQGTQQQALTQKFGQMRDALPGQYAGRGLLHSGIYAQGIYNYNQDKQNQFSQLAQQFGQQQHQADAAYAQQGNAYGQNVNDIDLQEAQARAQLAAQLKAIV